ncbi:ScyD/ScyE family protein [Kocuria sp. M1R5S2]|uniref:ScyD/ScyE family protein n=1 Tax=Kocuria rhizosphaerae TaxID=3376285 RepID=UPI003787978F
MGKLGAGAVTAAVVVAGPLPAALAHGGESPAGPRVVAEGLDNPRQLSLDGRHKSLVVAEAGRGGTECTEMGCAGPTGAVTLVEKPWQRTPVVSTVAEGFISYAGPDGSFAVGANGADATDVAGEYIVAGYDPAGPFMENGSLLVTFEQEPDVRAIFPYADLQAAEAELNPDGAQIHSNPYAVLFVDRDRHNSPDGYALVADAGANAVWKIEPDFSTATETSPPEYEITVFASWPNTALPDGTDDPEGPTEFVPTSLTSDEHGNVFVGGLGSDRPGEASVVQFSPDGTELKRWDGFTAVTGVAVDGGHLYVSQLFGPTPPMPPGETPADEAPPAADGAPGQVVVLHRHGHGHHRWAIDVPLPAGLAVSRHGRVYAAVNSVAPAEGIPAGPENPFGAIGGGAVWELDFSGAYRLESPQS